MLLGVVFSTGKGGGGCHGQFHSLWLAKDLPRPLCSLGLNRFPLTGTGSPLSLWVEHAGQQPVGLCCSHSHSRLLDVQAVYNAEIPKLIGRTHIPAPELKSSCFFKSWNCLKSFYIYWVWVFVLSDISCFLALGNKQTRTGDSYL